MWQEWFVMGMYNWRHENGDSLIIVHRNHWEVLLNHIPKTSRPTFEEAKEVADRYMQEFP